MRTLPPISTHQHLAGKRASKALPHSAYYRRMLHSSFRSTFITLFVILLTNCSFRPEPPAKLPSIYKEAAQRKDIERNAVIVIPGILGSRLVNDPTQQVVWGAFTREAAKPSKPASARLIALPMQQGVGLKTLRDTVRSDGALEKLEVDLFSYFKVQPKAYVQILTTLGAAGFRDETLAKSDFGIDYGKDHYNCFQFDYDWRRSNAENAILLGEFIRQKKAYIEGKNQEIHGRKGNVKFNIVAHSMGGLLARYYLRYGEQGMPASGKPNLNWAGAKDVNKVIMVGTPNSGSLYSLDQLVHGTGFGPFTFTYPAQILGTMPSIYELLPRARHRVLKDTMQDIDLDPLDPEVWFERGWGLANTGKDSLHEVLLPEISSPVEREQIAKDHLVKCLTNARHFQNALDTPSTPPAHLKYILFAGNSIDTAVQAEAWPGRIKFVDFSSGDETVARYSALGDERFANRTSQKKFTSPVPWSHVTFLFESHVGITQSRTFADNVLFELLENN